MVKEKTYRTNPAYGIDAAHRKVGVAFGYSNAVMNKKVVNVNQEYRKKIK